MTPGPYPEQGNGMEWAVGEPSTPRIVVPPVAGPWVGIKTQPTGPVTAGDLRALVSRMDREKFSDHALVEFSTPIAGDRRAVSITVIDHQPADIITVGAGDDQPVAATITTRTDDHG